MDFDPSPGQARALAVARDVLGVALPSFPPGGEPFARAAHAALEARGLFAPESLLSSALVVTELAAASPPLAVVALSGSLFARGGGPDGRIGSVVLAERGAFTVESRGGALVLGGRAPSIPLLPLASELLIRAESSDGAVLVRAPFDPKAQGLHAGDGPVLDGLSLGALPWGALVADGVAIADGAIERGSVEELEDAKNVLIAAIAAGVARRAFTLAVAGLEGGARSQSVEFSAADMAVDVDAAALSTNRAAWACDRGGSHAIETASAKLFAGAAATRVAHRALGIAADSSDASELRRCYLDAQFLELFGGGEREQENRIASALLEES